MRHFLRTSTHAACNGAEVGEIDRLDTTPLYNPHHLIGTLLEFIWDGLDLDRPPVLLGSCGNGVYVPRWSAVQ
jgi:hypothetical protein